MMTMPREMVLLHNQDLRAVCKALNGSNMVKSTKKKQRDPAAELLAAINASPSNPSLYAQLGKLLTQRQDWEGAELCFANWSHLQPQNAQAHYNWGVCLQELGRHDAAIEAFEKALSVQPSYGKAFYALGLSYQACHAIEAALMAFDCAIQADPEDTMPRIARTGALVRARQAEQALTEIQAMPDSARLHPDIMNWQGVALRAVGDSAAAYDAYSAAIKRQPNHAEALFNRANLQLRARRFSDAVTDFDRAIAANERLAWARGLRLYAAMHVFDWRDFDSQVESLISDVRSGRPSVQPLALECMVDEPSLHRDAAKIWTASQHQEPAISTMAPSPGAGRKIRLAYISRDFKSHPLAYLMAEVFELQDRHQFDLIAINYGEVLDDPMQDRLRRSFDKFLDVSHLSDPDIAALCHQMGVDVAIDLSGFTDDARTGILALRAAPIQVVYAGYLGTSGSKLYDYVIADRTIVPNELREFISENIVRLPSYQANDRQRPRPQHRAHREAYGLPPDGFVYCCFNNPCKITPSVFGAWMRILAAVPNSVLWVLGEGAEAASNLKSVAVQHGISSDRIVLADRTDRRTYLSRLSAADLFLDTLPYNAGVTASDALWVGTPVLTQIGRSFCSRVAASLLIAVGLEELIVKDQDGYIQAATTVGLNPPMLQDLKRRLAQPTELQLFDTPRFVRSWDRALVEMHRNLSSAGPARDIDIFEDQSDVT